MGSRYAGHRVDPGKRAPNAMANWPMAAVQSTLTDRRIVAGEAAAGLDDLAQRAM
jgi:hypothetical protein